LVNSNRGREEAVFTEEAGAAPSVAAFAAKPCARQLAFQTETTPRTNETTPTAIDKRLARSRLQEASSSQRFMNGIPGSKAVLDYGDLWIKAIA
jgi:flagellar hook-length control protein FliK